MVSRAECTRWALLTCRTMRWPSVSSSSSLRMFRERTVSPTSMAWTWPATRCAPWSRNGRWVMYCEVYFSQCVLELGVKQGQGWTSQLVMLWCLTGMQSWLFCFLILYSGHGTLHILLGVRLKATTNLIRIAEGFVKNVNITFTILAQKQDY